MGRARSRAGCWRSTVGGGRGVVAMLDQALVPRHLLDGEAGQLSAALCQPAMRAASVFAAMTR
jgi:hypothetical protein